MMLHLLPGKTYRPAAVRGGRRIRIVSFTPGGRQAVVVDAATGKGRRWVTVTNLHPIPLTSKGKPWATGYILED
jgi:hypothetical protein